MRLRYFILFSSFCCLSTATNAQSLLIRQVDSFSRATLSIPTKSVEEKRDIIAMIGKGEKKALFQENSYSNIFQPIIGLIGETKIITFDIVNNSSKYFKNLRIYSSIPQSWRLCMYKQALLDDWYSNQNRSERDLRFYGDPLLKLKNTGREFLVNLRPFETVRIVLEFIPENSYKEIITISVKNKNRNPQLNIPVRIYDKRIPRNDFNSIVFNAINLQIGKQTVDLLTSIGFTHLQVNYIPTVYFNEKGHPISRRINHRTSNSTGFRNTAYNWIRTGGKIVLMWQPRYKTLAPTPDGQFLAPFSVEWKKAFSNLLNILCDELKQEFPSFQKNQVVLYLADEISSLSLRRKGETIAQYASLAQYLKQFNPEIEILVTFGYYSTISDMNAMLPTLDIPVIHYLMPSGINRFNQIFRPYSLRSSFEQINFVNKEKWTYNVESGIKSDIRDFRFLPIVAASSGYNGFSWWAFASHNGSSWENKKSDGLNYSLYYRREPKNKIYQMWTDDTSDVAEFIVSMRLKAIQASLIDAKILLYLLDKKQELPEIQSKQFDELLENLRKYGNKSKEEMSYPKLSNIEEISNQLRYIYQSI